MNDKKMPRWALILIYIVVFQISGAWIMPVLLSCLKFLGLKGFYLSVTGLILQLGLIYEILGKFSILQAVKPPRFELTKVENWPHVNLDALTYYTEELQGLGFTILGDYTSPTMKGMMRIFAHSELACFAEVSQLVGNQIFCSVSSALEGDWTMAATNLESSTLVRATSYAFLRLPRKLRRYILKATPVVLLETFLDWRSQIIQDLSIQPLKDISVEMFFSHTHKAFLQMHHRLLLSSIVWRQLELLFCILFPQSDWLGDYPKLKARRATTV
jgi:hypothetical protein